MRGLDAIEQSYKNGYDAGKEDCMCWNIPVCEDLFAETEKAYRNGYAAGYNDEYKKHNIMPCHMCDNARVNAELTDDTDYCSITLGKFDKDCRIMLTSGWGKPLRIEIERWNDMANHWECIGIYYPRYCPNCGREIVEYKKEK